MNRLKELRITQGLTLKSLSQEVNISAQSLSYYELGQREADYNTLLKLATYYAVSVDYILGRKNEIIENELAQNIDPRLVKLIKESDISFEALNNLDDKKAQLIIDMIQNLIDSKK